MKGKHQIPPIPLPQHVTAHKVLHVLVDMDL